MNALDLFTKQEPRSKSIDGHFHRAEAALEFMGIDRKKATAEDWRAAAELVRMSLAIQSADVLDEQLTGFALLLNNAVEALQNLEP